MGKRKKKNINKTNKSRDKRKSKQVKYRDTIFRMLFGNDKEALLSLYNALNHTDYDNPELLEINTLEGAIYMGLRNDVSFILSDILNLYEHQSSINPNMPLRFLRYLSDISKELVDSKAIYSSNLVQIPTPKFVVFYNGKREQAERFQYRLSDAYLKKEESYQLELVVDVYNINPDNNEELKRACKLLGEYSLFVDTVNIKYEASKNLHNALKEAVEECIMKDILREFLTEHKPEVIDMDWLYEFDEEAYKEMLYNDGYEDGKSEGKKLGIETGKKLGIETGKKLGFEAGKSAGMEELIGNAIKSGKTRKEISRVLNISIEEINSIIKE